MAACHEEGGIRDSGQAGRHRNRTSQHRSGRENPPERPVRQSRHQNGPSQPPCPLRRPLPGSRCRGRRAFSVLTTMHKRLYVCAVGKEGFHGLDNTDLRQTGRSEEHTSELQSLMRISYAVFCLTKTNSTIYTATYRSWTKDS